MTESKSPATLVELLQAIERSQDLRSLARECGLTVRELRKRLAHWRRELKAAAGPADDQPSLAPAAERAPRPDERDGDRSPDGPPVEDLPLAEEIDENPLPATGSPVLEVYTDGASRGNPGPAAVGVVFRQQKGPALCVHREAIGRATNNQAEYQAVVTALQHCERWAVPRVHLYLDSELVVRQLLGLYRVKSQDLLPLYQQAVHLARRRREFRVSHLPRARNAHADLLANQALDAAELKKRRRR